MSSKQGKANKPLTETQILTTYAGTEPCNHGSRFWCEDCVNEADQLAGAIARQRTYETVARRMSIEAGAAYMTDKLEIAAKLKTLAKDYDRLAEEAGEEADKLRRAQGIIK